MKNVLAVLAPLLVAGWPASAGVLTCSFTEPFFTITSDSATGMVTRVSPDDADPETGKFEPKVIAEGARLRRTGNWDTYETLFLEKEGETIVELKVTGRGSDGMSDMVFPFEGRHGELVGGCESSRATAYDMYEAFEDLGVVEDQ